jgi:hypothetical protein
VGGSVTGTGGSGIQVTNGNTIDVGGAVSGTNGDGVGLGSNNETRPRQRKRHWQRRWQQQGDGNGGRLTKPNFEDCFSLHVGDRLLSLGGKLSRRSATTCQRRLKVAKRGRWRVWIMKTSK